MCKKLKKKKKYVKSTLKKFKQAIFWALWLCLQLRILQLMCSAMDSGQVTLQYKSKPSVSGNYFQSCSPVWYVCDIHLCIFQAILPPFITVLHVDKSSGYGKKYISFIKKQQNEVSVFLFLGHACSIGGRVMRRN